MVCLLFHLAPVSAQTDEAGLSRFTSDEYGFSLGHPEKWTVSENDDAARGMHVVTFAPPGAAGLIQVTLRIQKQPAGIAGPEEFRDKTLASIEGKPEYEDRRKITMSISGSDAPGLSVLMKAKGRVFRVHQFYLRRGDTSCTAGCHAPADRFDRFLPVFQKVLSSLNLFDPDPAHEQEAPLKRLAARCGADLPWEAEWPAAAARARSDQRLIAVLVRETGGFQTTDAFTTRAFMDPFVRSLIKSRFVLLRFRKGMGAPFESHDVYGMAGSTFGTSLLVCDTAGHIVGDTFCHEPSVVYDMLVRALRTVARDKIDTPGKLKTEEARIAWLLDRGELDRAENLLRSTTSALSHLLKARLLMRRRQGEQALESLSRACESDELTCDADIDRGTVLLKLARPGEAYAVIARCLLRDPGHERVPEAEFLLGTAAFRLAGAEAAKTCWTTLAREHPQSLYAAKAAASLTSVGFSLGVGEAFVWPSEAVLDANAPIRRETVVKEKWTSARDQALDYLLEKQRPDGSWVCATEAASAPSKRPGDLTVAVSALCGLSLLPHRHDPRVMRAVRRALGFLMRVHAQEEVAGDRIYYMDYGVWSRAYRIAFLARCIKAGIIEKERFSAHFADLIAGLESRQKRNGGWSYYVTRDLSKRGAPSEQSISFCTAAVVIGLKEMKLADLPVPGQLLKKGLSCLKAMANPDGTFEYMLFGDGTSQTRKPNLEGGAGRVALCAYSLHAWDETDADAIRRGLSLFKEFREKYVRETGKTLMHTGLGGQGSHYLLFDYAYAAKALALLPEQERQTFRNIVIEMVLSARRADGFYVDNPMIGPHAGTALALMAFDALVE